MRAHASDAVHPAAGPAAHPAAADQVGLGALDAMPAHDDRAAAHGRLDPGGLGWTGIGRSDETRAAASTAAPSATTTIVGRLRWRRTSSGATREDVASADSIGLRGIDDQRVGPARACAIVRWLTPLFGVRTRRAPSRVHRPVSTSVRSPATLMRLLAAVLGLLLAMGAASATARAATRYLAPDGLDAANDCATAEAPCASFRAAYAAADPGDEVRVAGGRYPAQDILGPDHTSGDPVVFSAAPGAHVLVDGIAVERSGVTLRGLDLGRADLVIRAQDLGSPPPVSDVTVEDVRGRNFGIFDATDVTIRGGEWGPATAAPCGGPYGGYNNSIRELNGVQPARIVIEDTVIHDVQSLDLERCHTEGLAIFAGRDVTVRRTRFFGNGVYDVFAQPNSGAIDGLTFENNWFAPSVTANGEHPAATIGLSGVTADVAIRNNSFGGPLVLDANARNPESLPTFENVHVTGNVGDLPAGGCAAGVDFAYNVWRDITCSATDVELSPLPFASTSTASDLDLHLTSGVAEDLVPAELAPADDIDGDPRPAGAAADAGADERSGVALPAVAGAPVLSPSGTDAAPCTAAQPCLTMARALRAAHPGDTVRMAAGVYHDMSLPGDASARPTRA